MITTCIYSSYSFYGTNETGTWFKLVTTRIRLFAGFHRRYEYSVRNPVSINNIVMKIWKISNRQTLFVHFMISVKTIKKKPHLVFPSLGENRKLPLRNIDQYTSLYIKEVLSSQTLAGILVPEKNIYRHVSIIYVTVHFSNRS